MLYHLVPGGFQTLEELQEAKRQGFNSKAELLASRKGKEIPKQEVHANEEYPDYDDYELQISSGSRTPNDDRSDSMNPNNPARQASIDNRANQKNPDHRAYHSSRGRRK